MTTVHSAFMISAGANTSDNTLNYQFIFNSDKCQNITTGNNRPVTQKYENNIHWDLSPVINPTVLSYHLSPKFTNRQYTPKNQ